MGNGQGKAGCTDAIDQEYLLLFEEHDEDHDGFINEEEFEQILGKLGIFLLEGELRKLFGSADFGNKRKIDVYAYLDLLHDYRPLANIVKAFSIMDLDGNGVITVGELKDCSKKLGDKITVKEASALMRSVDSDGDGNISFKEFASMMSVNGIAEIFQTMVHRLELMAGRC